MLVQSLPILKLMALRLVSVGILISGIVTGSIPRSVLATQDSSIENKSTKITQTLTATKRDILHNIKTNYQQGRAINPERNNQIVKSQNIKLQSGSTFCNNPIFTTSLGQHPSALTIDQSDSIYISNNGILDTGNQTFTGAGLNKILPSAAISQFGDTSFEPGDLTVDSLGNIYSLNFKPARSITRISTNGTSVLLITYPDGQTPQSMATDSNNNLYVAVKTSGGLLDLLQIDKITPDGIRTSLITDLTFPQLSAQIVIDSNNKLYFNVGLGNSDVMNMVDLNSLLPLAFVTAIIQSNVYLLSKGVNGEVYALTLDNQHEYIYHFTSPILPLSIINVTQLSVVPDERVLFQLSIDQYSASHPMYGIDYTNNEVVQIDQTSGAITSVTKTSPSPSNLVIDSQGNVFFSNFNDNTIRKIDCSTSLSSYPIELANIINDGTCDEVLAGSTTNCVFNLQGANYLFSLNPNSIILQLQGEGTTSINHTTNCVLNTLITIKCDGLPTTGLINTGLTDLAITMNGITQIKGQVFLAGTFSSWSTDGSGGSMLRPEIVSFQGILYETVRGNDARIYTRSTSDGTTWSNWQQDTISYTDYPVTMVVFNNQLYEASVGTGNLIYTRSTTNGINWTNWTENGGSTPDSIAMTSYNNKLYQAVKGNDSRIYTRFTIDGLTWTNWISDLVGKTSQAVSLANYNGSLYEAARGNDRAIYIRTTEDGISWNNWVNIGGQTNLAVTLTSFTKDTQTRLYLQYVAPDGSFQTRFKTSIRWSQAVNHPGVTNQPISSTMFKNSLFQASVGLDTRLYISYLS